MLLDLLLKLIKMISKPLKTKLGERDAQVTALVSLILILAIINTSVLIFMSTMILAERIPLVRAKQEELKLKLKGFSSARKEDSLSNPEENGQDSGETDAETKSK